MASGSALPAPFGRPITEKLIKSNFVLWKVESGKCIFFLPSGEHGSKIATHTTAAQVWAALEEMYSSQTRAWAVNTRIALATMKKEAMQNSEYAGKMRALADEMVSAGKPLDDEELVSYILTGLDMEFNPIASAVLARVEPISVSELYTQLLAFEQRLDLVGSGSGSLANSATCGCGGSRGGGRGCGANRGRGNGGRSHGGFNNNSNGKPKIN
nr:uncharacterized protein LOC117856076 [Setaria viridis]